MPIQSSSPSVSLLPAWPPVGEGVEWACLGAEVGAGLGRSGCHSV